MKIDLAKPEQARAIAEVQVLSWQQAYKHLIPHGFLTKLSVSDRESMWIEIISSKKAIVLTAEIDEQLVGFICVGDSRDPDFEIAGVSIAETRYHLQLNSNTNNVAD